MGLLSAIGSIFGGPDTMSTAENQRLNAKQLAGIHDSVYRANAALSPYERQSWGAGGFFNGLSRGIISRRLVDANAADYQSSPAEQAAQAAGRQAVLRSAAATGGLHGGGTISALNKQATNIYDQGLQQHIQNLQNQGQMGLTAQLQNNQLGLTGAAQLGAMGRFNTGIGAQMAGNISQNYMRGGAEVSDAYNSLAKSNAAIQAANIKAQNQYNSSTLGGLGGVVGALI